jgi:hypothetical protein
VFGFGYGAEPAVSPSPEQPAPNQQDAILAVYSPNATGAPSFVDQPPQIGSFVSFDSVAVDSQDRIVVAGEQNNDIIVGRYLPNLSNDSSFSPGFVTVDFSDSSEFNNRDFPLSVGINGSNHKITVSGVTESGGEGPSGLVAARFVGEVQTQFPPPPPVNGEGDVTEVEGVVSYDQLHQQPPPPPLDQILGSVSPGARLIMLSQPDSHGQAVIPLENRDNVIIISTVDTGKSAPGTPNPDKTKEKDIMVQIQDVGTLYYNAATIKRLVIQGSDGNDSVQVKGDVKVPLAIFGGGGNDSIQGGHGADLLAGGPGDDSLTSQDGSDVLIGGAGSDNIKGGGKEDLIIAGTTSYDSDQAALLHILDEWSTKQTVDTRIAHLRNGTGLNGPVVLVASGINATVFDDNVKDILDSGGQKDWIFYHPGGVNADQLVGGPQNNVIDLI